MGVSEQQVTCTDQCLTICQSEVYRLSLVIGADWFSTFGGQGPFRGGNSSLLQMFKMQR